MLKYKGLSKKTQVSGFKWNHWCIFCHHHLVYWGPGWLLVDHALLECYLGPWLITYCNGGFAYCTEPRSGTISKNTMSVTPPEKYMELVFLYYKNSIGPGALQSAQKQWWFSAKNKDGHCVFACCGGSGLAQWAKTCLTCFLHMYLRKWKTFADYFLLLEDLPDQLSYLCYL